MTRWYKEGRAAAAAVAAAWRGNPGGGRGRGRRRSGRQRGGFGGRGGDKMVDARSVERTGDEVEGLFYERA